jgi:hypothetical protein
MNSLQVDDDDVARVERALRRAAAELAEPAPNDRSALYAAFCADEVADAVEDAWRTHRSMLAGIGGAIGLTLAVVGRAPFEYGGADAALAADLGRAA